MPYGTQPSVYNAQPAPGSHSSMQKNRTLMALGGFLICFGMATLSFSAQKQQSILLAGSPMTTSETPVYTTTRALRAPKTKPSKIAHQTTIGESSGTTAMESTSSAGFSGATSSAAHAVPILSFITVAAFVVGKMFQTRHLTSSKVAMAAVTSEAVEYSTIQFPALKNDRLLRAVRGEKVDRIPVWIMRQAGRYLPEYRKFMADKEFFQVCRNPKQVAEITLQPVLRYDLDGSIIFSDILVIPQAMGLSVTLHPEKGPVFKTAIDSRESWSALQDQMLQGLGITVDPSLSTAEKNKMLVEHASQLVSPSLDYVYDAITETRKQLNGRVPLLGFCGAPMTLAIYMIEGGGSRTFSKASRLMHGDPETAHQILTVLAHMCAHYLKNQVKAGAQALQVFDSYAGALSPSIWHEFSYPYMMLIADIVKKEFPQMPMICFAKDAHYGIDALSDSKYDVIALDSSIDLGDCHKRMTAKGKAVQGNIDPTVLYAPPEKIADIVRDDLQKAFGSTVPTKYVANMGHGMSPDHDPVHLGAFIDAIHAFGQK